MSVGASAARVEGFGRTIVARAMVAAIIVLVLALRATAAPVVLRDQTGRTLTLPS